MSDITVINETVTVIDTNEYVTVIDTNDTVTVHSGDQGPPGARGLRGETGIGVPMHYHVLTLVNGQTEIVLPFSYPLAANALAVYSDGKKLVLNIQFEETDSETITLSYPAIGGEIVEVYAATETINPGTGGTQIPLNIINPQPDEYLMFDGNVWINKQPEYMTDGGNF